MHGTNKTSYLKLNQPVGVLGEVVVVAVAVLVLVVVEDPSELADPSSFQWRGKAGPPP